MIAGVGGEDDLDPLDWKGPRSSASPFVNEEMGSTIARGAAARGGPDLIIVLISPLRWLRGHPGECAPAGVGRSGSRLANPAYGNSCDAFFFTAVSGPLDFMREILLRTGSAAVVANGDTVNGVPRKRMFNRGTSSVEHQIAGFHEILPGDT
jgi:hypothetical protein